LLLKDEGEKGIPKKQPSKKKKSLGEKKKRG